MRSSKSTSTRLVTEIIDETIRSLEYTEDSGLRMNFSGGDDATGLFFDRMKIKFASFEAEITSMLDFQNGLMIKALGSTVLKAEIAANGDLTIILEDNIVMTFTHSDDLDGWELRWLHGKEILSLPGGGWDEN